MKYKYQLILLGSNVPLEQEILNLLDYELNNLGIPIDYIKKIDSTSFENEYSGREPAFALYFGDIGGSHKDLDITNKLLIDGTMILPIYFNESKFKFEIPCILENQNGLLYKKSKLNTIVNLVLESFDLLRNTRKVFISYKRNESTTVAIQLYESLEANNFDVFLDTHSIPKGESFQEELWYRMTDCDVIVLLNTSGFFESHWCKEEFAEADASQIGIVQLFWPDYPIRNIHESSHISFPTQLTEEDFIDKIYDSNGKFTSNLIEKISQEVESVRARNLASRQDSLITNFKTIAKNNGRVVTIQPEKILTEDFSNGERILYIPTIGIPQSSSCQSAEIKKELLGYDDVSIRLIYDDLRIRDKWLNHLDWLNDNFKKDIKTLKKQDFESWLQIK